MMSSLRGRLFVGVGLFVLITGLVTADFAFRWAFDEAIELQDSLLLQLGALALNNHLSADLPAVGDGDAEARVVVAEIKHSPDEIVPAASSLRIPSNLPDGLQNISIDGQTWRLLLRTRPDGSRVAIAQPTSARDEIARDSAVHTIVPLGLLIPCLMILVWIVIHISFKPVSRLAAQLDAKHFDDLQALSPDGMPNELRPFIASINRLLQRLADMFAHQRRFVASAAHELRTPLTALTIQAENLDYSELSPEGRERLSVLRAGINRTAHLVEQLLAHARYDHDNALRFETVSLGNLVKAVVADLLPPARARTIDLGFEHFEDVVVSGDMTSLTILVRNLLDNALRYAPESGTVDIEIRVRDGEGLLLISDTGPGIPEEDLERIFEPFNRGSRPVGLGTGLGLAIVQRIVQAHRGSITLQNIRTQHRTGLKVSVMLPLATRTGAKKRMPEAMPP
jgi:two-component system, OmpR family, sensor kinase